MLRECVRGILMEKEDLRQDEIILTADDILLALERKLAISNLNGVEIFTPYRVEEKMRPNRRRPELAKLNPFEVVSTAKYGSIDAKSGQRLTTTPADASVVLDRMAEAIARRFEDEGVVAVSCVDSSHGMAQALAEKVAVLLGVLPQNMVKKTTDPNVSWDEDEWAAYQNKIRTTGLNGKGDPLEVEGRPSTPDEYLDHTLKVMHRERDQARRLIKRGEKPSLVRMMNMKTGHKSLFNLFDKVEPGDLAAGSKVLIVDDNIDSGWTPYHVKKRMQEAGIRPLFAAGFKMMRYYAKKEKPIAKVNIDTPEVIDSARLADEWAVDLFQVDNLLMAMADSMEHGVQAADCFEVLKVSPTEVVLKNIDTKKNLRLSGKDLTPEAAHQMWQSAA